MSYEHKDGSGSLFKNDDKQQETHADYKGQCKINGVEMWVNAWKKETKNGEVYLSLSFKPKNQQPTNTPAARSSSSIPGFPNAHKYKDSFDL